MKNKIKDFINNECKLYSISIGEIYMLHDWFGISTLKNVFKYRDYALKNRFDLKLSLFDIFEEYEEAERVDRIELNPNFEIGDFN